jgi:hypothetical protein
MAPGHKLAEEFAALHAQLQRRARRGADRSRAEG